MDYNLNRTERIQVRVSPDELQILSEMAQNKGVTISDYLRWMGLWEAVTSGNRLALKMLKEKLSQEAREKRERFYAALRLPGIRKVKRT